MKASELIETLEWHIKEFGDHEVFLEAELEGKRTEQALYDALSGGRKILLVSKEACDADPLNKLPQIPNLSLVTDGKPH